MKKKLKVVELFSGIGSQATALKNVGFDIDVVATCEWDIQTFMAYDYIHNGKRIDKHILSMSKDELLKILKNKSLSINGKNPIAYKALKAFSEEALRAMYSSIINTNNLIDISKVHGKDFKTNIDLLTYSFPCQDLSNVGAFHGYNKGIEKNSGSRSSLLWEVGRILNEMSANGKKLPRFLVMENVPSLLSKRHIDNFNLWKEQLEELGYVSKEFLLNAKYFGIPQNRPRLLMLSIWTNKSEKRKIKVKKILDKISSNSIVDDYQKSIFYKKLSIRSLLRIDYKKKKYLAEAIECNPNNTISRRKIWEENPKIIDEQGKLTKLDCIRTITTKQDRHPNSGNIYFDSGIKGRCKWRYLTPRECLLFMGFTDEDYESLIKNNIKNKNSVIFPRDKIIRMAGNSIPVKLLEGFFYQLIKINDYL